MNKEESTAASLCAATSWSKHVRRLARPSYFCFDVWLSSDLCSRETDSDAGSDSQRSVLASRWLRMKRTWLPYSSRYMVSRLAHAVLSGLTEILLDGR